MIGFIKSLFKKKRRIWFTSDWHFSHRNVIPYCNRPYANVDEMNAAMLKIWNDTVAPNDIVFFLGDLDINGMRSFREMSHLLNGEKHLISGNHDATFIHQPSKGIPSKVQKNYDKVRSFGWASVQQELEMDLSNGERVLLSHLPYLDDDAHKYDLRYKEMRPIDNGLPLIHGHLHARYLKKGNMVDVGFDGKLGLYSEEEVIKLINDPRDFIPSRLTEFYNASNPRVLEK